MSSFMERAFYSFRKYPDRVALQDDNRSYTFRELDEISGKVYSWLKNNGIGAEDFVQIVMPREIDAIAVMFGVIRSGAAFAIMEDFFPEQRVEFIRKDINAKCLINSDKFAQIVASSEPLDGYEKTNPHQAAFAVYTSGSTGMPKGVLHEYGNLDLFAQILPEADEYPETTGAMISPFYFIASILIVVNCFTTARTLYVVSMSMVRNFKKFTQFLEDNKILNVYLSPSYIRLYKNPSPYIKFVVTGSEPANGIFYEGGSPLIQNIYTMTEAGFAVLTCILDKAYDVAPVGKPAPGLELFLIDEDGNKVEGAGKGEIVFRNPFVRGYINLPEKTKAAFIDGFYHTGDLARRDENGYYFIIGRADDMFKINGNRVEPGEVEHVICSITGLNNVLVKGFTEGDRSFICAYYLNSEAESKGLVSDGNLKIDQSKLEEILPRYMIPTYYIGLDSFPVNPNGKVVRRELKAPKVVDYSDNYVEPTNDLEKLICSLMAETLKLNRVGIEDDFYLLGGDSLSSITFVTLLGENGYDITDSDLFRARTPKELAKICVNRKIADDEELMRLERLAESEPQMLLPSQLMWTNICALHPGVRHQHIPMLCRMKDDIDIDRLKAAVDKAFDHYPICKTRIIKNDNDEYVQVYDPSVYKQIKVIEISDSDFENLKPELIDVLDMFSGESYRSAIYKTESSVYLFMHFHHAFFDGTGLGVIKDAIYNCYENPDYVIPNDYYFYIVKQMSEARNSDLYKEAEDHFRNLSSEMSKASGKIDPDMEGEFNKGAAFIDPTSFMKDESKTNLFYLTCTAIATAKCNKSDRAMVYLDINGRDRYIKTVSAGEFATEVPILLVIEEGDTPETLMNKVREQVEYSVSHLPYCYFDGSIASTDHTVMFLYQKDIYNLGAISSVVDSPVQLPPVVDQPCRFFAVAMIDNPGIPVLPFSFVYSPNHYSKDKVNEFAENFKAAAKFLSVEN